MNFCECEYTESHVSLNKSCIVTLALHISLSSGRKTIGQVIIISAYVYRGLALEKKINQCRTHRVRV